MTRRIIRAATVAALSAQLLAASAAWAAGGAEPSAAKEETPKTISIFNRFGERVAQTLKGYDEVYLFQEMARLFKVEIKFQSPPEAKATEPFNLMIASGDLPDLIVWRWIDLPGGPGKYIDDKVIIKINDHMAAGRTPYLSKMYKEVPEMAKQAMLDDGTHYMFPFARPSLNLRINGGGAIRKDWLDKVGENKLPETIDDWTRALTKFKTMDPNGNGIADEIPIIGRNTVNNVFPVAWKVRSDFQIDVDTGKVAFGPVMPGFRDYLATMAKWYREGLIDRDYITTDTKSHDAKMTGDKGGVTEGGMNNIVGRFNTLMGKNPKFDLRGVAWPKASNGVSYSNNATFRRFVEGGGTAISGKNKYVLFSLKFLDYAYGTEGSLLNNFGKLGESYTMVNGQPVFTDLILKNPQGLAATTILGKYNHVSTGVEWSFAQDARYATQVRASVPQLAQAEIDWGKSSSDILLPPVAPSVDDSAKVNKIMSEVRTYVDEMGNKIIMGIEPLSKFDEFVATIKKMGVDQAVQIMQKAYDGYVKR